jgi:hypothetical protein
VVQPIDYGKVGAVSALGTGHELPVAGPVPTKPKQPASGSIRQLPQTPPQSPTGSDGKVKPEALADFNILPEKRRSQLDGVATELILRHSRLVEERSGGLWDLFGKSSQHARELNYYDMAHLLTELKTMPLSDYEKAFVWSRVVAPENKGEDSGVLGGGAFTGGMYCPSIEGARPEVIDSYPGFEENTSGHSHIPFGDGYHGFGHNSDGEPGLALRTKAEALTAIHEHESRLDGRIVNTGDENASRATVTAFHAFRDASRGQQFAAFADEWIKGFVMDPPGVDPGTTAVGVPSASPSLVTTAAASDVIR